MIEEALANRSFEPWALRRTMGRNMEKLLSTTLPTISFDATAWAGAVSFGTRVQRRATRTSHGTLTVKKS